MKETEKRKHPGERCKAWWRATRYHFIPPSFLPAILGGTLARAETGMFDAALFVITVVAVTINHAALNMTDDYFDYRHAVDKVKTGTGNPCAGGSGTLTSGAIRPAAMRFVFFVLYALTAFAGIYLTMERGMPVLAFGLFGMLSSYCYSAPPVRYGARGFGELSQLLNFSLVIGLGSYFVQAGRVSAQAALTLLPLGCMMFAMIVINEIPDEADDRAAGKRTLVVIMGTRFGMAAYAAGMLLAYAIVLLGPVAGAGSFLNYLALLTFPLFARAYRILRRHYRDPALLAPANILTIHVHAWTGLLLILATLARTGRLAASAGIMALTLVFYLPALVTPGVKNG